MDTPLVPIQGGRVTTFDVESFSKTKAMELPRNVVVGHDGILQTGEVCASLKLGRKALVVADEITMKIAGATVVTSLAKKRIKSEEFLIPDATWQEGRRAEDRIRKGGFDFARGGGGGRPLDAATGACTSAVPLEVATAASFRPARLTGRSRRSRASPSSRRAL